MSQGADQAPGRVAGAEGPGEPFGSVGSVGQSAGAPAQPPAQWLPQTRDLPAAPASTQAVVARAPRVWERVLAAVAHLLMLASVPGLAVAIVIWLTQRRRSAYVAAQAKDAVFWQLLSNIVFVVLLAVLLAVAVGSLGGAVSDTRQASGAITHLVGSLLGIYVLLVVAALFFALSAVVGALFALFGYTFHYPIVGRRRKR
jgi:uncharacterized Tic20 family protein